MSEQVSVEVSPDGRPVAVKRATDEAGRERLRREAAMLAAAAHPGVVELVDLQDGDGAGDTTTLSTAWLGGGSVVAAHLAPKRLAGVGAALASTIADLHDRGIVHGRVRDEHVLLDGTGRVVLLGLAEASAEPTAARAADDVAGLGAVVDAALDAGAIPVSRLRAATADRETVERLRAIVLRACDPDPSRRPSARALAGLLSEVAGEPMPSRGPTRLSRPAATTAAHTSPKHAQIAAFAQRHLAHVGTALVALGAIVVVGFGARAALAGSPTVRVESDIPEVAASTTSLAPTTTRPPTPRVWPTSVPCPPLSAPGDRRDVDGDGCPDAVAVEGTQVVVNGTRLDVGTAGDVIAVADWTCDGTDAVAVLRPTTGEVFVFDEWATATRAVTARLVATRTGATAFVLPNESCGTLTVTDATGVRSSIALDAEQAP